MLPTVVVAADYAGTLVLSDRTDVRLRATLQTGAQAGTLAVPASTTGSPAGTATTTPVVAQNGGLVFGFDLANRPSASAQTTNRTWTFRLDYGPSFTLPDLELGFTPQVLNSGLAGIGWHSREVRLSLTETGSYGKINSGYLFQPGVTNGTTMGMGNQMMGGPPPSTTPANQLAPSPTASLDFVTSDTALRADVQTGKRSSFYVSAAYLISGGINTPLLPEQYGPRFEAGVTGAITRRDQLVTLASAQSSTFTTEQCISVTGVPLTTFCNPEVQIAQLTEGLRHSFDRQTTFELDAGGSLVRSRQHSTDDFSLTPYPAALAALTHVYRGRDNLTFRVDASYQPVIDIRSGYANNRVQADISLADSLNRIVRLTVTAAGAQTVPTDAPLAASLVRGDVELEVALGRTKNVLLSIGESTQWQSQAPYGAFFSTFGFLGVTVATQALRF
jgi:hypothetical protein